MRKQFIIIIITIFILLSAGFFALSMYVPEYSFRVLEGGNSIMALLSLTTWLMVKKQLEGNAQAFVRGVYGASFLKLMACMIAILVYVLLNRAHIHKPSVFILFGIYAVYTVMETWMLSKAAKED